MLLAPTLSLLSSGSGAIVRPTFSRDFAGERTLNNGTGPAITFTRGSQATYFTADGTLRFAPHNAIRNSEGGGSTNGVIGSGGVMPTNWFVGAQTGITYEVIGTGTENGLAYIDTKITGTNSTGGSVFPNIVFDSLTQVVAEASQVWSLSFYAKIADGSLTGVSAVNAQILESTSGGSTLKAVNAAMTPTATLSRFSNTATLTEATTARVMGRIIVTVPTGATIDLTLRVAAPQLERNATASDYIPTTGTANFDQPRFDHDPATGASRGLLIEEARTNSLRNSQGGGSTNGVISSGGALPTNWVSFRPFGTIEVMGVGTEGGLSYVEVKISGTNSTGSSATILVSPDSFTQVSASSGQSWTASQYVKLQAGSTSGAAAIRVSLQGRNTGNTANTENQQTAFTPTASFQRVTASRTLDAATTAHVSNDLQIVVNNSDSIDLTLRLAAPQLEQGAFPTSYIPTTSAAVTRSADSAVVTPISSFYNQSEGTLFAEAREGGSDLQYGAVSLDTNTSDNRIDLRRNANSASLTMIVTTAGAGQMLESASLTAAAQTYKFIGAYKTDDVVACVNGGTIASDTSVTLPTLTHLRIGGLAATSPATGNAFEANGHIRKIAYYPKRLSNALLQSLTA